MRTIQVVCLLKGSAFRQEQSVITFLNHSEIELSIRICLYDFVRRLFLLCYKNPKLNLLSDERSARLIRYPAKHMCLVGNH